MSRRSGKYPDLKQAVLDQVGKLWDEREGVFMDALEASPKKKLTLNFKVPLDCSKSDQNADVILRWAESDEEQGMEVKKTFSTKKSVVVEDPKAPALPGVSRSETEALDRRNGNGKKPKGKGGRPRKVREIVGTEPETADVAS